MSEESKWDRLCADYAKAAAEEDQTRLKAERIDAERRSAALARAERMPRPEPPPVTRQEPQPRASQDTSRAAWNDFIDARIGRREKTVIAALSDVVGDEMAAREKAVAELRRENERADELIKVLEKQIAALVQRIETLETRPGLRAVV